MSYREVPVQMLLAITESTAQMLGLKLKVELSDHSIDVEYTAPDRDKRAWDPNHYRNGNVFVQGYANPIKPRVETNDKLENPDTIDVAEGGEDTDDSEEREGPHVAMISSGRYRPYMRQDLVSQLLTPQEQWKLIAYGVLGLGVLQFVAIIITLYATGGF